MKADWNTFMDKWNNYNRIVICSYMRTSNKEQRKEVNVLLTDMKSSLKWCRMEDCENIYNKLYEIIEA